MSYAFSKTDKNHSQIVNELRQCGYDVDDTSSIKGLYDIVVSGVAHWSNGHDVAVRVEIKADNTKKLTPAESAYWNKQRHTTNLIKATCTGDVLKWFGAI